MLERFERADNREYALHLFTWAIVVGTRHSVEIVRRDLAVAVKMTHSKAVAPVETSKLSLTPKRSRVAEAAIITAYERALKRSWREGIHILATCNLRSGYGKSGRHEELSAIESRCIPALGIGPR